MLIRINEHGVTTALRHGNRNDLIAEVIALHGHPGKPLALGREGVLVVPAHAEAFRHHLGGAAHVLIGQHAPQAVGNQRVAHRHVAHAVPLAQHRHVGRPAHALHAAGNHHIRIARTNRLSGHAHGAQTRSAQLVDGRRRHGVGHAGCDGALARRPLPQAALQDAAHQHVVHLIARDACTVQGLADDDGAQIGGGHA